MIRLRSTIMMVALVVMTAAVPVTAEIQSTIDISAYNALLYQDGTAVAGGLATAEVEFAGTGNRMVRPLLQLQTTLTEINGTAAATLTVPRAEIKWRLPLSFIGDSYMARFVAGRSRLSWGDGAVLNAGDVINGAQPISLDLTSSTLRDETVWLLSGWFPLGSYSFLEPVVLVPGLTLDLSEETAQPLPVGADETGVGFRAQWKVGQIKMEGGYLYRGDTNTHSPFLSLQGNLYLDVYGAVSAEIDGSGDIFAEDSGITEPMFTVGLFHIASGPRGGNWSFRFEGLYDLSSDESVLFPEITWGPSELFNTVLRSNITLRNYASIVGSNTMAGLNWQPATGLTLGLFGSVATEDVAGAESTALIDTIDLDEIPPLWSLMGIVRYSY